VRPAATKILLVSLYSVLVVVVDAVLGLVTRREHRGLDRIPAEGPVVVVSNHLSLSDPLVLGCALRRAGRRGTFLAMAEAFSWPVVGWLLRRTGQIPVRRGVDPQAALEPALEALANGWVVALYPEGRITTEPDYRPLATARTGAVRLALAAGCPVVPVAQWGAHRLVTREHTSSLTRPLRWLGRLRPGRVPRRPTVTVLVGEPVTVAQLREVVGPDGDLRAATDLVMSRVRHQLARIAGDDLPDLLQPPSRDAA
jgi:1-acyl-sn-glycerol-3-phosphate acyltransferase